MRVDLYKEFVSHYASDRLREDGTDPVDTDQPDVVVDQDQGEPSDVPSGVVKLRSSNR